LHFGEIPKKKKKNTGDDPQNGVCVGENWRATKLGKNTNQTRQKKNKANDVDETNGDENVKEKNIDEQDKIGTSQVFCKNNFATSQFNWPITQKNETMEAPQNRRFHFEV